MQQSIFHIAVWRASSTHSISLIQFCKKYPTKTKSNQNKKHALYIFICCLMIAFNFSPPYCTSSMTTHICLTHWIMASGVPEIVTARSVELGSMSPATWTWAPVDWSGKKTLNQTQSAAEGVICSETTTWDASRSPGNVWPNAADTSACMHTLHFTSFIKQQNAISLVRNKGWILYLSHFFDFGASFTDERAALTGGHHEAQGDRGLTGGWAVAHGVDYILKKYHKAVKHKQ